MLRRILLVLGALVILSSPVSAVIQNKDGSILLTEKEAIVLMTNMAQLEDQRDELIQMVNELKKQLRAEQSKECI